MRAWQPLICRMQQVCMLPCVFYPGCQVSSHLAHVKISADTVNLVNDNSSLFRGRWVLYSCEILPMVSRVLNTVLMLYPFQDPPDLLAQSFDVGNFSDGECFFLHLHLPLLVLEPCTCSENLWGSHCLVLMRKATHQYNLKPTMPLYKAGMSNIDLCCLGNGVVIV